MSHSSLLLPVAIRMRPLSQNEDNEGNRVWKVLPQRSAVTQTTTKGHSLAEVTGRTLFNYDQTFGEETSTRQVYDSIAKDIVASVVSGLNGTIFAYGQTSSGKTYTMQGSGSIQEGMAAGGNGGGIVHMAANDIFQHVKSDPSRIFRVRASFLEIYNEEVKDLLTENCGVLQIREDPRRGVFVQSKEVIVTDAESLLGILFQGEKSRAFASTAMNERSSRSHTILRITLESCKETRGDEENDDSNGGDGAVRFSTLNLVDLAGSESVGRTGLTRAQQREGVFINKR
jgi:centromeric protein E